MSSTTPLNGQAPSSKMLLEPKDETKYEENISQAEFALFNSKRIQSDLEALGNKIKQHEDNLKFLRAQKNKLSESIVNVEVLMYRSRPNVTPRNENIDNNLQGEDNIDEQILQHKKSAAGLLSLVQTHHASQALQLELSKGVVGVVAKLGMVNDDKLSQVLSDYLGTPSMLAVVCKNHDSVLAFEKYDNQGNIDKNAGLHGLCSSIGRTVEGHFDLICLDNLRPYVGKHIANDPQRRLDLLKPKLPNGECPPGFLGFAVNMIQIDPKYLFCVTSYGYGLRETLFYSLFSRLQVYKTRAEMGAAIPCISDGAISLDGGIIRTTGIFTLGSCDEMNVKFAKPTPSTTLENYTEMEKQMKELKWKIEKTLDDMKREKVLHDHTLYSFSKKKDEFVRFLAQSSSANQRMK